MRPRVLAAKRQRDARCGVFTGHRGVVQKEGVPCRPPKEDICVQHYPVAIETSSGAVGGWGRRRVGKGGGRTGAWGQGAGSCSSGAVASRARTRRRGPRGHGAPSPAPGPRPTCHHGAGGQAALPALAWPSQGNKSSPVPSSVPSRVQVGDGVLEKSAWRVGTERPCLPAGVPASKRAGPRGSGVALGLSPVCRLVSPLYLPPCLHHRCDFVVLPHSPEAMGSGPPPGPCQTGRGQAWEGVRLFSPPPPSPTPPGIC